MLTKEKNTKTKKGCAFVLRKGDQLKITDHSGGNICNMILFNARNIDEKLCAGKTLEIEKTIALSTGNFLWSNRNNKLVEILKDTHKNNDILMPPCPSENQEFDSCLTHMLDSLRNFSIKKDDISNAFNVFKNVTIDSDGTLSAKSSKSNAGDHLIFKACTDVIVGLTAEEFLADDQTPEGVTYKIIKQ